MKSLIILPPAIVAEREHWVRVIARCLADARKDADLSQHALGERLWMSRNQIASIEGQRREIAMADYIRFAKACKVDQRRLLDRILTY